MSPNLGSPPAREDPRLNITDLFTFKGETGTVLVMGVNTSLACGEPGFHPDGRYEFKIHLDDSPTETMTLRFEFGDAESDPATATATATTTTTTTTQGWSAFRLDGMVARDDAADGELVLEGTTSVAAASTTGIRVWAGRALDPFYLDLAQLGAIGRAIRAPDSPPYGEWSPSTAKNTFAGSSIHAIVVEIPFDDDTLRIGRSIAVWATSKLATDEGGWHPINRAGLPMTWAMFRSDSDITDAAHLTRPEDDRSNYAATFAAQVAGFVAALGSTSDPQHYAEKVAAQILPDLLRYEVGTPASFGFAGRNGRFLTDNAPEVMFSVVSDSAIATGLTPASSAVLTEFPYVTAT